MRDSELPFQLRQLGKINRPDDVDDSESLGFGGQNGEALDHTALAHDYDIIVSRALAANVCDPRPSGRIQLRADRIDISQRVLAFLLELEPFHEDALQAEYQLLDLPFVGRALLVQDRSRQSQQLSIHSDIYHLISAIGEPVEVAHI